jgi:hypothetical protein
MLASTPLWDPVVKRDKRASDGVNANELSDAEPIAYAQAQALCALAATVVSRPLG